MKVIHLITASLILIIISCHSADNTKNKDQQDQTVTTSDRKNVKDYDLSKPTQRWQLEMPLMEISGNTWVDKDHLIVIEDLHPNLYLLNLRNNAKIEKTIPFETGIDKKFDIEDVTLVNNVVYALWSHGVIFRIDNWNDKESTREIPTFLDKKNNTEGICFDPVTNQILVACKNGSDIEEAKKSTKAVYSFDLKTEKLNEQPFMVIEKKDFKNILGDKLDFYPSAIAVHPVSHDIYILSTKENKCMARYSHDGKLISVQFIDKDLMPQPEGICFSPEGNLFISSEGKHGEPGRLFEYDVSH